MSVVSTSSWKFLLMNRQWKQIVQFSLCEKIMAISLETVSKIMINVVNINHITSRRLPHNTPQVNSTLCATEIDILRIELTNNTLQLFIETLHMNKKVMSHGILHWCCGFVTSPRVTYFLRTNIGFIDIFMPRHFGRKIPNSSLDK